MFAGYVQMCVCLWFVCVVCVCGCGFGCTCCFLLGNTENISQWHFWFFGIKFTFFIRQSSKIITCSKIEIIEYWYYIIYYIVHTHISVCIYIYIEYVCVVACVCWVASRRRRTRHFIILCSLMPYQRFQNLSPPWQ